MDAADNDFEMATSGQNEADLSAAHAELEAFVNSVQNATSTEISSTIEQDWLRW